MLPRAVQKRQLISLKATVAVTQVKAETGMAVHAVAGLALELAGVVELVPERLALGRCELAGASSKERRGKGEATQMA